jgi:hypothetical protein
MDIKQAGSGQSPSEMEEDCVGSQPPESRRRRIVYITSTTTITNNNNKILVGITELRLSQNCLHHMGFQPDGTLYLEVLLIRGCRNG